MSPRDLDHVRIVSPCTVSWQSMEGDERVRHCGKCDRFVHRLAALTSDEVTALLELSKKQQVCVSLCRRVDGTVRTKDAPAYWSRASTLVQKSWRSNPYKVGSVVLATLLTALVAIVLFFGDNVRLLFASSTDGGLMGTTEVRAPATPGKGAARAMSRAAPRGNANTY